MVLRTIFSDEWFSDRQRNGFFCYNKLTRVEFIISARMDNQPWLIANYILFQRWYPFHHYVTDTSLLFLSDKVRILVCKPRFQSYNVLSLSYINLIFSWKDKSFVTKPWTDAWRKRFGICRRSFTSQRFASISSKVFSRRINWLPILTACQCLF